MELGHSREGGKEAQSRMLHDVVALLRIFAVFLTTTASAEKSFNQLRKLLRESLNGLALLSIHGG